MLVAPPRGPHPAMRLVWFWRGVGLGFVVIPCLGWPVVLPIGFGMMEAGIDPLLAFASAWTGLTLAWLVGVIVWVRRGLRSTTFDLGGDVLRIRKGIWMRKLTMIPLSQVHGFVIRSGPLLRHYGLSTVRIRTGRSGMDVPWEEATLPGVADAVNVVASLEERRTALTKAPDASSPTLRPVFPAPKAALR